MFVLVKCWFPSMALPSPSFEVELKLCDIRGLLEINGIQKQRLVTSGTEGRAWNRGRTLSPHRVTSGLVAWKGLRRPLLRYGVLCLTQNSATGWQQAAGSRQGVQAGCGKSGLLHTERP